MSPSLQTGSLLSAQNAATHKDAKKLPFWFSSEREALPATSRVYLSISSEGYGHSSRALALARYFGPDELLIGSYGYALERVEAFGYPCVSVPQELKFIGAQGRFDIGKTILHNQSRALGFNQVIQHEMELIKRHEISLVVADGRMAAVLAAAKLNIPCLVLTNQSAFYPFFEQNSALVKLFGHSFDWVMKLWLSSAEEILIPDFPPPNTVCLPNLSQRFQVKKRTRFVGPLVAWRADEVEALPKKSPNPLVVVTLGGHDYRRPLFDAVLELAKACPNIDFELLSTFSAHKALPDNITIRGIVPEPAPYFKAADLVITQGGHSTAMELLTLGKPSIIVPDQLQIEQENNARRMVELGVSQTVPYNQLSSGVLKPLTEWMLEDCSGQSAEAGGFRANALGLAQQAAQLDGAFTCAQFLRQYAQRLLAY